MVMCISRRKIRKICLLLEIGLRNRNIRGFVCKLVNMSYLSWLHMTLLHVSVTRFAGLACIFWNLRTKNCTAEPVIICVCELRPSYAFYVQFVWSALTYNDLVQFWTAQIWCILKAWWPVVLYGFQSPWSIDISMLQIPWIIL